MNLLEIIRKTGNHYTLYSHKGKALGHGSEEEMKKREKQIQYFKHVKEDGDSGLMTHEYASSDEASKAATRLGITGFHIVSSGVYKPGSSEDQLRAALADQKADHEFKKFGEAEELHEDLKSFSDFLDAK